MGYKDNSLKLSASQAVTADALADFYIDTELTNPPWKKGTPLAVVVTVETKTTPGTGITFELIHKASAPGTGDATMATFVFLAADLVKGAEIVLPLPKGMTMLRYFSMYYNITGGTESYVLSAYLTPYGV